jgi:UTP--glucose-1-phosphate uridylyltransferase
MIIPKVRKAIFPVAGLGTRFLPATKANPKEMLPIVDKPLIQYAVEEAIRAGITELIFVTNHSKRAIEDHFDTNFELEYQLEKTQKFEILKQVQNIVPEGVRCIYIRQPKALGLGHAVWCAKEIIGNEPFAVLLADDLIESAQSCLSQMINVFENTSQSLLAVQKIPLKEADKYGIVEIEAPCARIGKVTGIIEKPHPSVAPSDLGVVGRYILTPAIFDILAGMVVESNNNIDDNIPVREIQLTDAISELLKTEEVFAYQFIGKRYDCGSKLGYLQATIAYALKHPELADSAKSLLKRYAEPVL